MDLALNNLQRLICHKTQQTKPNQTNKVDEIKTKRSGRPLKLVDMFTYLSCNISSTESDVNLHLMKA